MLFFAVHISYIPPRANRIEREGASRASRPPPVWFRRAAVSGNETTRERFLSLANVPSNLYLKARRLFTLLMEPFPPLSDVVALATLGGARSDRKTKSFLREPKNQSAGRRPAGPPSEPPLFLLPRAARSLLELAVQGVFAEVRVVLHELQALGGVAAVLRRERARTNRVKRRLVSKRASVSVGFAAHAAYVGGKSQRLPSPSRRA